MPAIPPTLAALLLAASTASAAITIPTVSVGDAGNPAYTQSKEQHPYVIEGDFGSVPYEYRIGKYEVTNKQYTAFLNAVAKTDAHHLYDSDMSSSHLGGISRTGNSGSYLYETKMNMADKPVNFVSFWDAARFVNWLTNGQPIGPQGPNTTENGMYNLGGVTNPDNSSVTRQLDFSAGENGVAIASNDEWYKAAYYDGGTGSSYYSSRYGPDNVSGYFRYPTQSLDAPTPEKPVTAYGVNNANYNGEVTVVTTVGAYTNSGSHYGTFDQGGNVYEISDTIRGSSGRFETTRGLWGGAYNQDSFHLSRSRNGGTISARSSYSWVGFRVSSLAPIAPLSLVLQPHIGGTVNPTGTVKYPAGTEVTVTATPDAGYVFDSWSGSVSGTTPQIIVTLDQNHDITATFIEDQEDPDLDGLTNYEEASYGSNPNVADTSGDGLNDGVVANAGVNPTTDLSGLISSGPLAMDSNRNGLTDSFENAPNSFILNNLGYYTQQSLTDGRPGAITISADNQGGVTLELQIQRSDDLVEWSSDPADLIQIPLTLSGDKEFFRFAIPE